VEWANFLKHTGGDDERSGNHPLCWDQDTCGFFFDGTVIETIVTASGELDDDSVYDSLNDKDGVDYLYFCTMSLTEEQQHRLLPDVHTQWTQNADPWNYYTFADALRDS
jgi:hypothetical protein